MFTVQVEASRTQDAPEAREFQKRSAAIDAAKTMSNRTWRPVRVADAKEIERMEYRGGELSHYEYDLRRKSRLARGKRQTKSEAKN